MSVRKSRNLILAMLAVLAVLCLPIRMAWARDYSIDRVQIDSTVNEDGSVKVSEQRTFDFDGHFNGVYWRLPKGIYEGRKIDLQVNSVGEIRDGNLVTFEESNSEQPGTYTVTDKSSALELKIFSPHDDEDVVFAIDYTALNLVSKWEDTAELYWKFVSDGWDEESQNVTCVVHLPVPAGQEVVPEQNVRAWGHGPLDANVKFEGNDVVYTVPGVGTSEFAEARITFPVDWVPAAQQMSDVRLEEILAQEQKWADEANAERARARVFVYGTEGVMGGSIVLLGVLAFLKRRQYKLRHRPQFDDKYFRDVPSEDHPAVLGALYRNGSSGSDDFAASVMRLADEGLVALDVVTYEKKGVLGRKKQKQDYRLLEKGRVEGGTRGNAMVAGCDRVDRATLKFLFQTVANHHAADESLMGPEGERYVLMSYLEDVARRSPQTYENGYNNWKSSISSTCEARKFFVEDGGKSTGENLITILGVIEIILGIAMPFVGLFFGLPALLSILLGVGMVAMGIGAAVVASTLKPISSEAIELKAKLKALRRWLKEFTKLDEAVPNDVVLWNRLLVMATALGVADEVVEQLKVALPQILDDPYFYSYGWYSYGSRYGMRSPASSMRDSFGSAHSVSAAKLADSSDSSGGGGGGGFSGGGGGGFGGGGGGGAF